MPNNPTPSEDLTEARRLIEQAFKNIEDADKTPEYDYHGKRSENRRGEKPKVGCRWLTPREIIVTSLPEILKALESLRAISLPKGERPTNRGAEIDLDEDDLATAVYKYRDSHPVQTEIAVNSPPRFSRNHWKELVEREQAGDIIADHIAAQDAHIDQLEAKLNGGK